MEEDDEDQGHTEAEDGNLSSSVDSEDIYLIYFFELSIFLD